MAESRISLKLLIDTQGQRVLFAEAGKDFVDFLFHTLSLPVATVISLLRKQETVSSLINLYESVEKLNDSYIQRNQSKYTLLKPPLALAKSDYSGPNLLQLNDAFEEKKFYRCGCSTGSNTSGRNSYYTNPSNVYFSDDPRAVCPRCGQKMTTSMVYVAPPAPEQGSSSDEGGFVKGVVTYMVMDDLEVKPMSTTSIITLLNKFNIRDLTTLEEKVVGFGMDEAVKLLHASLHSKTVLTDSLRDGLVVAMDKMWGF